MDSHRFKNPPASAVGSVKTLIHDETYIWKGRGTPQDAKNSNCWESSCRMRIWQGETTIILWTDLLEEDSGTSITNSAEGLATLVARDFAEHIPKPSDAIWIEHYPTRIPGTTDPTLAETFARVKYQWKEERRRDVSGSGAPCSKSWWVAHCATWQHITREAVEQLVGATV